MPPLVAPQAPGWAENLIFLFPRMAQFPVCLPHSCFPIPGLKSFFFLRTKTLHLAPCVNVCLRKAVVSGRKYLPWLPPDTSPLSQLYVSQAWHCWHFGLDNSSLQGARLCLIGPSLVSIHEMLAAPLPCHDHWKCLQTLPSVPEVGGSPGWRLLLGALPGLSPWVLMLSSFRKRCLVGFSIQTFRMALRGAGASVQRGTAATLKLSWWHNRWIF